MAEGENKCLNRYFKQVSLAFPRTYHSKESLPLCCVGWRQGRLQDEGWAPSHCCLRLEESWGEIMEVGLGHFF